MPPHAQHIWGWPLTGPCCPDRSSGSSIHGDSKEPGEPHGYSNAVHIVHSDLNLGSCRLSLTDSITGSCTASSRISLLCFSLALLITPISWASKIRYKKESQLLPWVYYLNRDTKYKWLPSTGKPPNSVTSRQHHPEQWTASYPGWHELSLYKEICYA